MAFDVCVCGEGGGWLLVERGASTGPVKISHKKDCHQMWTHRFNISLTSSLDPLLVE